MNLINIFLVLLVVCLVMFFVLKKSGPTVPEVPQKIYQQGNINVMLLNGGANKVAVLAEIRKITGLGLKEIKDMIDSAPQKIIGVANIEDAEEIKSRIEAQGGTVEIKQAE